MTVLKLYTPDDFNNYEEKNIELLNNIVINSDTVRIHNIKCLKPKSVKKIKNKLRVKNLILDGDEYYFDDTFNLDTLNKIFDTSYIEELCICEMDFDFTDIYFENLKNFIVSNYEYEVSSMSDQMNFIGLHKKLEYIEIDRSNNGIAEENLSFIVDWFKETFDKNIIIYLHYCNGSSFKERDEIYIQENNLQTGEDNNYTVIKCIKYPDKNEKLELYIYEYCYRHGP